MDTSTTTAGLVRIPPELICSPAQRHHVKAAVNGWNFWSKTCAGIRILGRTPRQSSIGAAAALGYGSARRRARSLTEPQFSGKAMLRPAMKAASWFTSPLPVSG
jgi:hypothetical protein